MKILLLNFIIWVHKLFAKLGLILLPNNFYIPHSDLNTLLGEESSWRKRSELIGIEQNLDEEIIYLEKICKAYLPEVKSNPYLNEAIQRNFGLGYGYVEAQVLHALVRDKKPKTVIEVGSGISSFCIKKALELNEVETHIKSNLICIEPYPKKALTTFEGITLRQEKIRSIDVNFFQKLEAGDLLFIDSSHTVKPGGDVNYLFLEVIPRLKPGVIIHIHDINFPYDYQRNLLSCLYQWSEGTLLQALLINNSHLKIFLSLSQLHYDKKEELSRIITEYKPQKDFEGLGDKKYPNFTNPLHFPSSIYLETV